jgi:hypothetical protein
MPNQIRCGPSGGAGGYDFQDDWSSAGRKISKIVVRHGDYIDALQIHWADGKVSKMNGGSGGEETTITLQEDEYLIGIQGRYGTVVHSIVFHTTRRSVGPYGGDGGHATYSYNVGPQWPNLEIVAFFGRAGAYIDAIGCVLSERPLSPS